LGGAPIATAAPVSRERGIRVRAEPEGELQTLERLRADEAALEHWLEEARAEAARGAAEARAEAERLLAEAKERTDREVAALRSRDSEEEAALEARQAEELERRLADLRARVKQHREEALRLLLARVAGGLP
jgi:F0F1-type ATP synthase membrane subunit b/b'